MSRTVLIGLDGATFAVLDPLMERGVMPFLKQFAARGVRAELRSTVNPQTAQAWPSMITGRSPEHHGIVDFVRFEERPRGAFMTVTNSRDLCCETIWSIASRQQRTVTSLNFYGMCPPQAVAGYLISGFVPWRHLKDAMFPRSLYDRLKALPQFNRKELAMDLDLEKKSIQGLPAEQYADWIALHIRREQQWFEILRYLMTRDPTDLTAVVFDGVDKIQHLCWRMIDPALYPAVPTSWEQHVHELCLAYFRQLDGFIAEIVAQASPVARVFIVSDHGFGASTEIFYINTWLHQHGYLAWADEANSNATDSLTVDRLKNHLALVDWNRTTAYAITPSSNGICIRVAGDGKQTGVAPHEYESFRARLIELLLAFTDPATGQPVVTRVQTREEAYPGPQLHRAPDLLVTLRDGGFVSILNADAPLKPRSAPAGTHRPEGIFIANGPGLRAGVVVPQLSILDVAPTLLYSLDLPINSDLEGALPASIFEPSFLSAHPARLGEPASRPERSRAGLLEAAEAAVGEVEIIQRLRALGYLE